MDTDTSRTVGVVARMAGLTVRTLHHYHDIGLVQPSGRSDGGFRLYGRAEIERLQEVLFFRELGFPLDEIRKIVDRPDYDRVAVLRRQREQLIERADRVLAMVDAVDMALEARSAGMNLSDEEMLEVFGDFDPSEHAEEAQERWGDTDAFAESMRRTTSYTKDDWASLKAEGDEINQSFLELMAVGVAAAEPEAMDVAERHRAHISKWFYDCSIEIHAGLGQIYVSDQRFTANIDQAGAGLAAYMSEAIAANAARA